MAGTERERTRIFLQRRGVLDVVLKAFGAVVGFVLVVCAIKFQFPWRLVVPFILATGGLLYVIAFTPPTEVRLTAVGLQRKGGLSPKPVFMAWREMNEIKKHYEPPAAAVTSLVAPPLLSALIPSAPALLSMIAVSDEAGRKIKISREVDGIDALADEIETRTVDRLGDAAWRLIDGGGTAHFGALSVSRSGGVVGGTMFAKGSVPLSEVSKWGIAVLGGVAGGYMLLIHGQGNRRVGATIQNVVNAHVLMAVLERLKTGRRPGGSAS